MPASGANPYAPPAALGYGQPGLPAPGYPGQPTGAFAPPTSGFPGQPTSGFPGQPTSGFPGQPTTGFPGQPGTGYDAYGQPVMPGYPQQQGQPRKKRGLMITMIVLVVALVLCGGGGAAAYFLTKNSSGKGQASPVDAVNGFLKAVYNDKDAAAAETYVCSSSRNNTAITKRISDIRAYDGALKDPAYTWGTPTVKSQTKDEATVLADVKLTTSDEKTAESKLSFITTHESGWFVCEITAG
jgi:hypothetical protein